MNSARVAAYEALKRVSQGAYSNIALNDILSGDDIAERDKALASAIFYGVLERERQLDDILAPLLSRPLKKLEKNILIILRMGVFQLAYMDRIPDSAAVNESVALAKGDGLFKAAGLVNGVLRSYIRAGKPTPEGNSSSFEERMAACYSAPEWIAALWKRDYGEQLAENICKSFHGKPPVYARINNTVCGDEIGFLSKIEWLDGAAEVTLRGAVEQTEQYRAGRLHIQDLSSQICCRVLAPLPDTDIIDVCAAPGGKAFTIAELTGNRARITACDLHAHRVGLIAKGAERLHLDGITALRRDALCGTADDPIGSRLFDAALCDVPCSGLGVIRRKPDVMKKQQEEIAGLPELQYSILERTAALVKKGGTLMYSTCTLCRAENGGVTERFLREHPEFEGAALELPRDDLRSIDEPEWCLTLFPHAAGSDGFYMAKFVRRDEA